MKNKINIIRIVGSLLFGILLFYFQLPALNLKDPSFYGFLFIVLIFYLVTSSIKIIDVSNIITNVKKVPKNIIYIFGGVFGSFIIIMMINLICSPLFNSNSWANRITIVEDAVFTDDVNEVDFSQVPLLDKMSSQKLGDRVMGQMSELVSQYSVSNLYTQINYNDSIIRVTPLEYADAIKWFTNRKDGIVGYITVDSVDGESKLVRLDKGMKYSPSDAVDSTKRAKIIASSQIYLKNYEFNRQPRFDIIEVYFKDDEPIKINHIENAFDSQGI
jgi:hypothetical protein